MWHVINLNANLFISTKWRLLLSNPLFLFDVCAQSAREKRPIQRIFHSNTPVRSRHIHTTISLVRWNVNFIRWLRACCHFAPHMLIVFENLIPKTPLDVNYRQLNEINWCYFSFHTHTDTHTSRECVCVTTANPFGRFLCKTIWIERIWCHSA